MPNYPQLGNGGSAAPASISSSAQPAAAPAANNYTIAAPLTYGNGGAGAFMGLGGDPATTLANLGTDYANSYNSSLAASQTDYNNAITGYNQLETNQRNAENQVQNNYGQLSTNVLAGISGIGSDQQALINRQYQQQAGTAQQGLISSGLGNSTVLSSVNRGIGLDQALASNNLANSIAQTKAGYQSNIGLAGLNYQGNAINADTNLGEQQLNFMNSVNVGYPNAAAYTSLAQQAGAAQQSNANRALLASLYGQTSNLAAGARQAGVTGGGLTTGTGGRLPPSAINAGAGAAAPGAAGGLLGSTMGGSFASTGYGAGAAGAAQQAGRGVAGAATGAAGGLNSSTMSGALSTGAGGLQAGYMYGSLGSPLGSTGGNYSGGNYQSYNYGQNQGGYNGNPSESYAGQYGYYGAAGNAAISGSAGAADAVQSPTFFDSGDGNYGTAASSVSGSYGAGGGGYGGDYYY